jgi:hypothetical protein
MIAARLALYLGLFVAVTHALGGPQSIPSALDLRPQANRLSAKERRAQHIADRAAKAKLTTEVTMN